MKSINFAYPRHANLMARDLNF